MASLEAADDSPDGVADRINGVLRYRGAGALCDCKVVGSLPILCRLEPDHCADGSYHEGVLGDGRVVRWAPWPTEIASARRQQQ